MHLLQFGLIAVCESLLQGIWSVGSALQAATPISWHWRSSMDNHWPHVNLELLRCSGFKLLSPVSCRLHYSSNAKHVMTCYFDPWDLKPSSFHVRRKVYANNYLYNHHSFKGQQENDPSWSRIKVECLVSIKLWHHIVINSQWRSSASKLLTVHNHLTHQLNSLLLQCLHPWGFFFLSWWLLPHHLLRHMWVQFSRTVMTHPGYHRSNRCSTGGETVFS